MSDTQYSFCAVPTPTGKTIYAGPGSRDEFDRIPLPAKQHDWKPCSTATVLKGDGRQWERRITSKMLDDASTGITIIFQWSEERAIEPTAMETEAVQP